MWIMTSQGMLSIVQHNEYKDVMLVRSRDAQTIERLFPNYDPIENRSADYRWRAFVPRLLVAETLKNLMLELDYGNFKNTVKDDDLHDAYMTVWATMRRYQVRQHGPGFDDSQYELGFGESCPIDDSPELEETYHHGWPAGMS